MVKNRNLTINERRNDHEWKINWCSSPDCCIREVQWRQQRNVKRFPLRIKLTFCRLRWFWLRWQSTMMVHYYFLRLVQLDTGIQVHPKRMTIVLKVFTEAFQQLFDKLRMWTVGRSKQQLGMFLQWHVKRISLVNLSTIFHFQVKCFYGFK